MSSIAHDAFDSVFKTKQVRKIGYVSDRLYPNTKKELKVDVKQPFSFSPNVNRKSDNLRSSQEFYADMMKFKNRKQERTEMLKKSIQEQNEVLTFAPDLCKNSVKLTEDLDILGLPTHERLYRMYKKNKRFTSDPTNLEFSPKINYRSKVMTRESTVSDILYKDAVRRMKVASYDQYHYKFECSTRSNAILIGKFTKEFDSVTPEKINYMDFCYILKSMKFVKTESDVNLASDLWRYINKEHIKKTEFKAVLLKVMGYSTSKLTQFRQLAENRRSEELTKFICKTQEPSHGLAKKYRHKVEDKLLAHHKIREAKLKELREESLQKMMRECTFSPLVKSYSFKSISSDTKDSREGSNTFDSLFSLSKQTKKLHKSEEIDKECTFTPKISRKIGYKVPPKREVATFKPSLTEYKAPSKHVLHKKLKKKIVVNEEEPLVNIVTEKKKENEKESQKSSDSLPTIEQIDLSFNEDLSDESAESVFEMTVNIGLHSASLVIEPEQTPENVVDAFSLKHGLTVQEQNTLLNHIKRVYSTNK